MVAGITLRRSIGMVRQSQAKGYQTYVYTVWRRQYALFVSGITPVVGTLCCGNGHCHVITSHCWWLMATVVTTLMRIRRICHVITVAARQDEYTRLR